ncbi:MAG: hypothetical protein K1X78_22295 [Verrucomicrobiaceae bacterium]|nr:hypothetical protein [Verrucomicrobiaceae bacterium]
MNPPAAQVRKSSHLELMDQIQAKLQAEYDLLLKRRRHERVSPPRRRPSASPASMSPGAVARRMAPRRRRGRDWRGVTAATSVTRIFVLMLLVHVIIIGGIILADFLHDATLPLKLAAGVCGGIALLRGMGALCRGIPRRRTTSACRHARNCDRDIWL